MREIFWNPDLDVAAFVEPHHPVQANSYIAVFLKQFLREA
jgi:hypothetical protein